MRTPLVASLAALVTALSTPASPAPAQGTPTTAQAAAVVAFALDQFKALEPGVTLARWRATHPTEPVFRYVPPEQNEQHRDWCAHTDETRRLSSGQIVRRTAWFYPPAPTSTRALPTADSATLFGRCRIGMIEVVLTGSDAPGTRTLVTAITQQLTSMLGPQTPKPEYSLVDGGRWSGPVITVVAGIGNGTVPPDTAVYRPTLQIAAALKNSQMGSLERTFDLDDPALAHPFPLDELFALAALDDRIGQELRASLEAVRRHHDPDWRATAAELPPPRRAAALLVADKMVGDSPQTGWGADSGFEEMAARFTALGAPIVQYLHATIAGELHFLVARAWGDIINLGSGGGFEVDSSDAVRFKAEIPVARQHALAEYRAALAMLPDGPERKDAWIEGWRLQAGLAPIISHFYCTND